jgi:hypothetical protein
VYKSFDGEWDTSFSWLDIFFSSLGKGISSWFSSSTNISKVIPTFKVGTTNISILGMFSLGDKCLNMFPIEMSSLPLDMLVVISLSLFDGSLDSLVNGGCPKTCPDLEGFEIVSKDGLS